MVYRGDSSTVLLVFRPNPPVWFIPVSITKTLQSNNIETANTAPCCKPLSMLSIDDRFRGRRPRDQDGCWQSHLSHSRSLHRLSSSSSSSSHTINDRCNSRFLHCRFFSLQVTLFLVFHPVWIESENARASNCSALLVVEDPRVAGGIPPHGLLASPRHLQIVSLCTTCLLYTSPSPRDS